MGLTTVDVAFIAFDGINSHNTGVGSVVSSFVRSINEFEECLSVSGLHLRKFSLATPFLSSKCSDFRADTFIRSQETCNQFKGKLLELNSLASGESKYEIWAGPGGQSPTKQWDHLAAEAARIIESELFDGKLLIVFTHDSLFAGVSKFLKSNPMIKIVWIPHSLGATLDDMWSKIKAPYELDCIKNIANSGHGLGLISWDYKRALDDHLDFLPRATFDVSNFFPSALKKTLEEAPPLNGFVEKIPPNKKIIFSWGRCTPVKSWELVIPAVKRFLEQSERGSDYVFVAVIPTGTAKPEYEQSIMAMTKELPKGRSLIKFQFSFYDPLRILCLPNLDTILFASKSEGMSMTALEAKSLAHNKAKILFSDIPSFNKIFANSSNARMIQELTEEGIFSSLTDIATWLVPVVPHPNSEENAIQTYADIVEFFSQR